MKKIMFAVAAVAALAWASPSAAEPPALSGCPAPVGAGMGLHPGLPHHGAGGGFLSSIFRNHGPTKDSRRTFQMLPVATTGTLVFPVNPFLRSPRDFFMWDER